MSRSKWKGFYVAKHFIKKDITKGKNTIDIWNRNSTIPFYLVNEFVRVHNGKEFINIYISREKIGFKFGEFVPTRKDPKVERDEAERRRKNKK